MSAPLFLCLAVTPLVPEASSPMASPVLSSDTWQSVACMTAAGEVCAPRQCAQSQVLVSCSVIKVQPVNDQKQRACGWCLLILWQDPKLEPAGRRPVMSYAGICRRVEVNKHNTAVTNVLSVLQLKPTGTNPGTCMQKKCCHGVQPATGTNGNSGSTFIVPFATLLESSHIHFGSRP